MSDSEQGSEEQWDDMAIVRAFEEALTDQRTRNSVSGKPTGRKHKATSRTNGKKAARSVSVEEESNCGEPHEYGSVAAGVGMHGQSNVAAYGGNAAESNPFTYQQQQTSSDVYQTAYAQAYAQLQAQFQAAYPALSTPQAFAAYPSQSPHYPPPPPIPSIPAPFPGMPSAAAPYPASAPSAAGLDDGLANVLMAWYQSGYYTGRFQAMQEMKMRGHR